MIAPLVLLNPGAGTLAAMESQTAERRIVDAFAAANVRATVRFVTGKAIEEAAREGVHAAAHDAVIAGGGDGTLNSIANILADSDKPFGVLPLGTHNHFAKDLGLPLDLDAAIAALASAPVFDLPVAEVNGRLFLNFSGLGLHPRIVQDRDDQRKESGRGKWFAMLIALARQLYDLQFHRITLAAEGQSFSARTASVIICNNPHQMRVFGMENASVPDRGLLNVYVATAPRRRTLLWLMLKAAFGRIDHQTPSMECFALPEIHIQSRHRQLSVSLDGEVTHFPPPLHYRIRPRPLRVLLPAPQNAP